MPKQSPTTQVIVPRSLIVYNRPNNNVWQCRYKVADIWQRATTNETNLNAAIVKARELQIDAEVLKRNNVPIATRYFRNVAKLAIEKMEDEIARGVGKVIYNDYIQVINKYLIEILGRRKINNIDYAALNHLDAERIRIMRKQPSQSTLLTHNAALNKVFEVAIDRGWVSATNIPKLSIKGNKSTRRPAFDLVEVQALLGGFDSWIGRAANEAEIEWRLLLRDYVEMLLYTGMRHGTEALGVCWNNIEWHTQGDKKYLRIWVDGKTGGRWLIAKHKAIEVLKRLHSRQKAVWDIPFDRLFETRCPERIFVFPNGHQPMRIDGAFKRLMRDSGLGLSHDGQMRTLYSLRHTYATLELLENKTDIHTLSKQMGNSAAMIDRHYSKLTATMAADRLA